MSASTGAPSALARSEGSIDAAKGTAAATAAAPPAQAPATTSVRRPRLRSALSFMEKSLREKALAKTANYTESVAAGQISCSKLLILSANSGILPGAEDAACG